MVRHSHDSVTLFRVSVWSYWIKKKKFRPRLVWNVWLSLVQTVDWLWEPPGRLDDDEYWWNTREEAAGEWALTALDWARWLALSSSSIVRSRQFSSISDRRTGTRNHSVLHIYTSGPVSCALTQRGSSRETRLTSDGIINSKISREQTSFRSWIVCMQSLAGRREFSSRRRLGVVVDAGETFLTLASETGGGRRSVDCQTKCQLCRSEQL